jgi:hypothetical protein
MQSLLLLLLLATLPFPAWCAACAASCVKVTTDTSNAQYQQ